MTQFTVAVEWIVSTAFITQLGVLGWPGDPPGAPWAGGAWPYLLPNLMFHWEYWLSWFSWEYRLSWCPSGGPWGRGGPVPPTLTRMQLRVLASWFDWEYWLSSWPSGGSWGRRGLAPSWPNPRHKLGVLASWMQFGVHAFLVSLRGPLRPGGPCSPNPNPNAIGSIGFLVSLRGPLGPGRPGPTLA